MRFEHPVFQGPRKVSHETVVKIDEYSKKEIRAWRVHRDLGRPGLVASRRRFVDTPDSEILSGGTNMKGDRGVPLVREGNIFLWGFAGSPDEMTEPGKAALVNAIHYMRSFAGQAPTRRIGVRDRASWRGVLDSPYVKPGRLRTYFGPVLHARHGLDKESYRKDLLVREPYLFVPRGTATLEVDADAEAMGHPTNSLALIRAALEEGGARGARVLERYWPEDDLVVARPRTVEELDRVAAQVIFSETHGYRWLSRPPTAAPEAWEVEDALAALEIAAPTAEAPAIFDVRLVGSYNKKRLAHAKKLGLVTLAVRARVLDGWHVTIAAADPMKPAVSIDATLAPGMRWHDDDFTLAGRMSKKDGTVTGRGVITWTRRIWLGLEPGVHDVQGTIRFQVCDDASCMEPVELPFTVKVKVR